MSSSSSADATLRLGPPSGPAGPDVPDRFVGFSVEWTLVDRYMGAGARPVLARLLANLDAGVLRIGGGSQDQLRFTTRRRGTEAVIAPADLEAVRATLNAAPGWQVILGTAVTPKRPWATPRHAHLFVTHGVVPAFAGAEERVVGIELGNEPDISYRSLRSYLAALEARADVTRPFGPVAPATATPLAPWAKIAGRSVPTRFFWHWPEILDSAALRLASDHFYPTSRACRTDRYRCASIRRLLSDGRMATFAAVVREHAGQAARHDVAYRVAEINSAAGRGVERVSDTAGSALWALDAMFTAARHGAVGVNFHNAEVRAFLHPEQGNAYYNPIRYDPGPARGAPSPAPMYYALLLFAGFAQGGRDLRPAALPPGPLKGWQLGATRLFLINRAARGTTVNVEASASTCDVHRLTPHDLDGRRKLGAPAVTIDGRRVRPDGTWPGFRGQREASDNGRFRLAVGGGEAVVISLSG